ncbi:MAG: pre-peptidase C-terminal domain-containing protein [Thermoguttaceae bacterium]|nr:pre-peptidase C-terminal domain-containing protein [Thermoguttaceae bacterium]
MLRVESLEPRTMLSLAGAGLDGWDDLLMPPAQARQPAAVKDDVGNTFAAARSIALSAAGSGSATGNVETVGDVDMFKVVAPGAGRMTVNLTAEPGSAIDPIVYVYDASKRLVGSNDDADDGTRNSSLTIDVAARRTYYIKAAAYGVTRGAYRVAVSVATDDFGNDFGQAAALTPTSAGAASKTGIVDRSGDVDFFRFVAPVTGQMTITNAPTSGSRLDPVLYVYDSARSLLASNDDYGATSSSRVTFAVTAGAAYYIKAAGYGATTGGYRLSLSTAATSDDGNTFSSATRVTLTGNGSLMRNAAIDRTGDVDMFRFVAAATGSITIGLSAATGSRLDPYLIVYNGSQRVIGQDDDSGGGVNSQVTVSVTAGATYYIRASAYGNATTGDYVLQAGPGMAPSPSTGEFDITLALNGLTASQRSLAQRAAARWEAIIVGDLPSASYNGQAIDDVLISITSEAIDGAGSVLGYGGPEALRNGSYLPYVGIIVLDTADLNLLEAEGDLLDVFTHEIAHALGFGTIWDHRGLLAGVVTSDPVFTGAQARAEYNALFGTNATGVPVEAGGGQGTAYAHWRDTVFQTELMTGWSKPGASPISRITVASMADLGYQVNMAAAEAYARPASLRGSAGLAASSSTSASTGSSRNQWPALNRGTAFALAANAAGRYAPPAAPHVAAWMYSEDGDRAAPPQAVDRALEAEWDGDLFASLARSRRAGEQTRPAPAAAVALESIRAWLERV